MISSSADLRSRDFGKILLIKLSAVGDVIHTIPVLNKLRRRYPAAQLDWLVTPAIAELLRHNPAISNVIEFDREEWSTTVAADAVYQLRASCLAAAQHRLRSGDRHARAVSHRDVHALATGAPVRIGFDRPRASVWDASPREFRRRDAQTRLARRARGQLARLHASHPGADPRSCMRSTATSASGGFSVSTTVPPIFRFRFPKRRPSASTRLIDDHGAKGKKLAVLAPGTIWETKQWRQRRLCGGGAPFPAKRVCRDTDRRRARACRVRRGRTACPGRGRTSPAKPR